MTRDMIRERVFGKKASTSLVKFGDATIAVRSPTVGERSMIIDRATAVAADGTAKMDFSKLQLYAVIMLCYDEAGTRIFDDRDYDNLSKTAVDDELDALINAAVGALKVKKEDNEAVGNG